MNILVSSLEVKTILKGIEITKKPFKIGEVPTFRNDKINQNYFRKEILMAMFGECSLTLSAAILFSPPLTKNMRFKIRTL